MAKLTLDFEEDYDFDLIGISSHVKDYRLSWELNNALGFDLKKESDYELLIKGIKQCFPFFAYSDEDNMTEYFLIGNRSEDGILIPEENNSDYFLLVKGYRGVENKGQLIKKITGLKHVLTSYEILVEPLKSKNNLLF